MRKDLTPEECQLVLDYGLRNLQKGPDGGDGQLVLLCGTIKYLAGQFKVDKTSIQSCIWNRALESYYSGDTDVFHRFPAKILGWEFSQIQL